MIEDSRQNLISRGRAITSTLGLVIRSQRRYGGIVSQERLQSALAELIKPGEVDSIALLNAENKVVVSAGEPLDEDEVHARSGLTWSKGGMMLANLVDLGTNVTSEAENRRRAIVVPFKPPGEGSNNPASAFLPPPPWGTNSMQGTNRPFGGRQGPPRGRGAFGRPSWMSEEEYQALIARQGLHSFVIAMSTRGITEATSQDLWLRFIIGLLATASTAGAVVAWRSFERSSDLELRLVKASEMNSHLKQMNLAAAGLAHETRNPLNIIRGLAQMISKQLEAPSELRDKSRAIIEETDRVTAQLNEFINYSRPREVRLGPVDLGRVSTEVARALAYDAEEKKIQIKIQAADIVVEADEQLLRQALFNLLLNAIQAAGEGESIRVLAGMENNTAYLAVEDSGPGVPMEKRAEIFKPYFTTHTEGTGLGLAVVRQIVLAHGWDIECKSNEPKGAVFKIGHLRLLPN